LKIFDIYTPVLKNILGSGALARLLAQRLPNLGRSSVWKSGLMTGKRL